MRSIGLIAILSTVVALCGCTTYEYLVEEPDAPLYATRQLKQVIARMPDLHHEEIDDLPEDGEPAEIRYQGKTGFSPQRYLSFFSYSPNDEARDDATRRAIRSAILRDKDWKPEFEEAIENDRVRPDMTFEMVELALGLPDRKERLDKGWRWIYSEVDLEVYESWGPGWHVHPSVWYWYGRGSGWGVSWRMHPTTYRTYVWTRYEQHLDFNERGRLVRIRVEELPY